MKKLFLIVFLIAGLFLTGCPCNDNDGQVRTVKSQKLIYNDPIKEPANPVPESNTLILLSIGLIGISKLIRNKK